MLIKRRFDLFSEKNFAQYYWWQQNLFYMNKQINLLLFIVTSAAFLLHESPSTKLPYKNIYFKSELFGTKVGQEFSWVSTLNNG